MNSKNSRQPDDLYDAVKSAGGGTVTKSAIKAYLEANQLLGCLWAKGRAIPEEP